jgi:hypothetical protein
MSGFLSSGWGITSLIGGGGGGGGVGPTGPQGPAGPTGPSGSQGPSGSTGPQGPSGSIIYTGSIPPNSDTGSNGDFYIQTGSAAGLPTLYGPKTAGAWSYSASLVGPSGSSGTNGTVIYTGSTAPNSDTGSNGDFYIQTGSLNFIYGPKTSDAWSYSASLVGPSGSSGAAGASGSLIYFGTTAQQSSFTFRSSDFFFNTDTSQLIYGFGSTPVTSSLRGDPGINTAGVWNAITAYTASDVVVHSGSSYIFKYATPTSGIDPTGSQGSTYWDLLAGKGDSGSQGSLIIAGGGNPTTTPALRSGLRTQDYFLDTGSYVLYGPYISTTDTFSASSSLRGPVGSIDILTDVVITAPVQTSSYLKYNGANWVNTSSIALSDVQNLPTLSSSYLALSNSLGSTLETYPVISASFLATSASLSAAVAPISPTLAGTYSNATVTVDNRGRVTAASNGGLQGPNVVDLVQYFGNGLDQSEEIGDGEVVILSKPTYYNNLTISGSGYLDTNNFPVFVSGTLDLTQASANAIRNEGGTGGNGGNGSGATNGLAGTAGSPASTAVYYGAAGAGTGGTAGTTGTSVSTTTPVLSVGMGGAGGAGGRGGNHSNGTPVSGQAGNSGSISSIVDPIGIVFPVLNGPLRGTSQVSPGCGGTGGSGGAGDTTNARASGGGGGGGGGGGYVVVMARTISLSPTSGAPLFSAVGGNGGNGGNIADASTSNASGGGGGGGGGGGVAIIGYQNLSSYGPANTICADGGNGGNGGNARTGTTFGKGGTGGRGGAGGVIYVWNFANGSSTITDSRANQGILQVSSSNTTGTTGSAGTQCRVQLI